jgi:hypothetical protein
MTRPCIDSDTLEAYFGATLSDEEKIRMMEHITECHACLEKFASADSIMRNPDLDEWEPASEEKSRDFLKGLNIPHPDTSGKSMRERITACYNRIISPLTAIFRQPELALVRSGTASSADEICLIRKVGDLQTEIYVEELEKDNATISVKVFGGNRNAENISLTLIKDDGRMFARNLRGDVMRFDDLPQGCYQFILSQNGREKGSYTFEVSEKGLHEKDNLS